MNFTVAKKTFWRAVRDGDWQNAARIFCMVWKGASFA